MISDEMTEETCSEYPATCDLLLYACDGLHLPLLNLVVEESPVYYFVLLRYRDEVFNNQMPEGKTHRTFNRQENKDTHTKNNQTHVIKQEV